MEIITCADIYSDPLDETKTAFELGTRSRGLAVKTGSDQGVDIEEPLLATVVARISKRRRTKTASFFPFKQQHMRKVWLRSQQRLGFRKLHPLHALRHTKPSADARSGRRTLEEIRRRGRWSQIKSVQRYSRGHAVTMHLASLPTKLRNAMTNAEQQYPRCLAHAIRRGPAASSQLGLLVLEVLDSIPVSR